jgi:hypothetical protein
MPTLLRELMEEASRATNGEFPAQQTVPKATMIEPLFDDSSPMIKTNYTSLENSNIIPEPYTSRKGQRTPINPPLDYQMNNQNNFSPNLNTAMLRDEKRNISFEQAQYMQRIPDSAGLLLQPTIAGSVSPMKAVPSQPSVAMRIKERFNPRQGQSCIDTLNHISNCPMCSRYFQGDSKVYHVIIFMLIVLLVTI